MYKLNEKDIRHDPEDDDIILINLPITGEVPVRVVFRSKKIENQIKNVTCQIMSTSWSDVRDDSCIQVVGGIIGYNASGDAIITMHHMGYDLTNKDDMKKAKKSDKEKIQNEYKKLLNEQPELFGENDTEEGDKNSPVTIDYDKFNNKKTIHSAHSIRYTIAKNSCEKMNRKVAALGISLDAYLDLSPRLVDTKDLCIIVIDVHYGGDDWIFLDSGKMVVIADDTNFEFQPKGDKTDVKSGMAGNISEDVYYPLSIQDFEILANAEKIEVQISGKSSHVEFATNLNTDVFGGFYNAVFDGDEPIMAKNDVVGVKNAVVEETNSQETQPKSEEVDVEKELEKFKGLLDKGFITQEQYDAKSNKLLGL